MSSSSSSLFLFSGRVSLCSSGWSELEILLPQAHELQEAKGKGNVLVLEVEKSNIKVLACMEKAFMLCLPQQKEQECSVREQESAQTAFIIGLIISS